MAAKSFTLTTAAAKTRLSDVYIGTLDGAGNQIGGSVSTPDPRTDIPYRQLLLQADAADIVVGDTTVTATNFGVKATFAAPPVITPLGPFDTGPMKLSDLWAIGAGGKLHILGIPY